jgi:hypothetical protein
MSSDSNKNCYFQKFALIIKWNINIKLVDFEIFNKFLFLFNDSHCEKVFTFQATGL